MKLSRRSRGIVLVVMVIGLVLLVANIQQLGQAVGGFYEWKCSDCGTGLYCCPGKRLAFASVPSTYRAHSHTWQITHPGPHWSRWKPWQWLVFLLVDAHELQEPDPQAVFPTAHVDGRCSDLQGLRSLATDPQYERKNELPQLDESSSAPG